MKTLNILITILTYFNSFGNIYIMNFLNIKVNLNGLLVIYILIFVNLTSILEWIALLYDIMLNILDFNYYLF